jgi:hypothetical protein
MVGSVEADEGQDRHDDDDQADKIDDAVHEAGLLDMTTPQRFRRGEVPNLTSQRR